MDDIKGIERITAAISGDAAKKAARALSDATAAAERLLSDAKTEADKRLLGLKTAAEAQYESELSYARTSAALNAKKASLLVRQQLLGEVFDRATGVLDGLGEDEYLALLVRLVTDAAGGDKSGEVVLDIDEFGALGAALLGELGGDFTLAAAEPIGRGAILRRGRVEYNLRLTAILARLRENEMQAVASILFDA